MAGDGIQERSANELVFLNDGEESLANACLQAGARDFLEGFQSFEWGERKGVIVLVKFGAAKADWVEFVVRSPLVVLEHFADGLHQQWLAIFVCEHVELDQEEEIARRQTCFGRSLALHGGCVVGQKPVLDV